MNEKKQEILEQVAQLYFRRGLKTVTMDEVASTLGISKKTLYQLFVDKRHLVAEVIEYVTQKQEENFNQKIKGNAIDKIFAIREHVVFALKYYNNCLEEDLKTLYPDLHQKVYETKRRRIFDHTIENLKQGMQEGLYRTDLDPYFIAKLQVGRLLYTLNPDYGIFSSYEVNSIAFFDSMMNYHMAAICTPKGIDYYKKQLNKIQNEE